MLCGSLNGRGFGETMDTSIYMAEFLCASPETTTTLLISYIPVQNVFGVKKIKFNLKNQKIQKMRRNEGNEEPERKTVQARGTASTKFSNIGKNQKNFKKCVPCKKKKKKSVHQLQTSEAIHVGKR